jgi:hypothetical protein
MVPNIVRSSWLVYYDSTFWFALNNQVRWSVIPLLLSSWWGFIPDTCLLSHLKIYRFLWIYINGYSCWLDISWSDIFSYFMTDRYQQEEAIFSFVLFLWSLHYHILYVAIWCFVEKNSDLLWITNDVPNWGSCDWAAL